VDNTPCSGGGDGSGRAAYRRRSLPALRTLCQRCAACPASITPRYSGDAGSAEEGVVRRGAAVAQEVGAALGLGGLTDPVGGPGQGSERAQEAAVGLVLPRDGAVALPAVTAQQV